MRVQTIDRTAKALVKDAGGNVQEVDSDIETMPGRFIPEYEITMPAGTLSLAQKNAMSNLDEETYYLLPTNEIVVIYRGKLNTVHYALEDAYKIEVRKANANA